MYSSDNAGRSCTGAGGVVLPSLGTLGSFDELLFERVSSIGLSVGIKPETELVAEPEPFAGPFAEPLVEPDTEPLAEPFTEPFPEPDAEPFAEPFVAVPFAEPLKAPNRLPSPKPNPAFAEPLPALVFELALDVVVVFALLFELESNLPFMNPPSPGVLPFPELDFESCFAVEATPLPIL